MDFNIKQFLTVILCNKKYALNVAFSWKQFKQHSNIFTCLKQQYIEYI